MVIILELGLQKTQTLSNVILHNNLMVTILELGLQKTQTWSNVILHNNLMKMNGIIPTAQ
jgi:hypothetical protein